MNRWLTIALRFSPRWLFAFVCGFSFGAPAAISGLDWQTGPSQRSAALVVAPSSKSGFSQLPAELTGITFTNLLAQERSLTNQMYLNGSGVAAGDIDDDGWCDLYFCGLDGPNVLYRNLGNWKFQDGTQTAGLACEGVAATGAALVDIDGDGDLDLIVASLGNGTLCFRNDGKGRFADVTTAVGLHSIKGGMSMALADIDGDGFLDLYVANYRVTALSDAGRSRFTFKVVNGRQVLDTFNGRSVTEPDLVNRFRLSAKGGIDENGEEDDLYLNQGGTNFVRVPFTGGSFLDEDGKPLRTPPLDWGLSVMFRDINGDGLPDIYVCNDFDTADRIWINRGGVKFQALPRLAMRKSSLFSMGVDFADINRDGFDDFLVLDMLSRSHTKRMNVLPDRKPPVPVIGQIENRPEYSQNTLFLNRGDTTYAEIANLSGLEASEWSWCPIFLDVDLDGWEDVLITNGHERDARNIDVAERLRTMRGERKMSPLEILHERKLFPGYPTANFAFRNRGDLTFEDVSKQWGFNSVSVSHGMALADLDNDGDLDVAVNNLNGLAGIYRNDTGAPRVAVRLKGKAPNTRGIGAKIKVFGGPVSMQSQEMICGGRYLSSDDPMRVFAAGTLTNRLRIEVAWRSGKRSLVSDVKPNCLYEIDENGAGASERASARASERQSVRESENQNSGARDSASHAVHSTLQRSDDPTPFFEDVSVLLQHTHHEDPFDDYARQPLLPKRLSQLGPGVAWFDLDGDGRDDLIVASGKGGQLGVYRNEGQDSFKKWAEPPLTLPITRDQTTVLGWQKAPGQMVVLVGSSNYEDGLTNGSVVRQFDLANKVVQDSLPGQVSSTGPLAMADLDGDGNLDLFVGGRVVPGRYPEAASSLIFRAVGGGFALDEENTKRLAQVGLVSGAVWSDLDGDGFADLILACEWGPLRVFRNERGKLAEATEQLGIARFKGWWNGVTTGDFDGDGKLDIVASNWGRNSKYQSHRARPLRVYYGDLNGDGSFDVVEAWHDQGMNKLVPVQMLDVIAKAMPFLRERFTTHQAYGEAGVVEVFRGQLGAAPFAEAVWLESTLFLNRGDHFEAKALPLEAQMAPAFGLCVGDFDGDGNEDLFLSQNFFAVPSETPRYDGGRGLWLRGDGNGGFSAVPGQESGVKIYGEQRGAALCDYDGDGKVDLAVAQNGAETKLFHNHGAKPGLRVRLSGPPGNRSGVGATMWLIFGQRSGPAREVHAGSGYWSQDSPVQVLATPAQPTQLWVRWPGGKVTASNVPPGAGEVQVNQAGEIKTMLSAPPGVK